MIVALVSRQLRDDLQAQNEATLQNIAAQIEAGADPFTLQLPAGTEFIIETSNGFMVNATQHSIEQINELDINPIDEQFLEDLMSDGFVVDFEMPIAVDTFTPIELEAVSPQTKVIR